jgi:hypothetical protein
VRRTEETESDVDALVATGTAAAGAGAGDCVSELATDGAMPAEATMVVLSSAPATRLARKLSSLKTRHLLRDQRLRG